MAPLARTLVAAMAIGVSVALARAELDRRAVRARRERERHFGLLADERLADGLQRMALAQIEIAIEQLEGAGDTIETALAVHDTRKALKRLRALVALVEDELGSDQCARERTLLRDAGRRLAGARDAEVRLATLDGLIAREGEKLAHRRGVARLRARLVAERDAAAASTLSAATRAELLLALRQMHARVDAWRLTDGEGLQIIAPALRQRYRRARRGLPRDARGSRKRAAALHEWRKRVKDLRYAAEILDRTRAPREPAALPKPSLKRRERASGRARYIRRVAREADELGELLGYEHDLGLLADYARDGRAGRGTRRALLKLIKKRRRRLRREVLRIGRRLLARRPARFLARARSSYERALSRR